MTIFLTESRRDDLLLPYVNLLRKSGVNTNVSQLKQVLLKKFVNEGLMRNLSLDSNFYLAGVARYYFNGDLTSNKVLNIFDETQTDNFIPEVCERLNACIVILRNAYIDSVGTQFEQPEDFGTLKLNALLRKYNKKINAELGIDTPVKKRKNADSDVEEEIIDTNVGNGYTFDILYSFEDAKKYNKYTEPGAWCITYAQTHYNSYVRNLKIHYVILRKEGYENVPRRQGENFTKKKPHDEYGNSLIALLQSNTTGEPVYITSRWNHGSSKDNTAGIEADHAYTKEEFFHFTGLNDSDLQRIQQIWNKEKDKKKTKSGKTSVEAAEKRKQNLIALRYLKYGQMRMNGGESVEKVFEGVSMRYLAGKENDFKKSIVGLEIPVEINDQTTLKVQILCVKGKMLFESFMVCANVWSWLSSTFQSSRIPGDNMANGFNDVIRIKNENYVMLYDIKRNQFINVDGTIKFKYIQNGFFDTNIAFFEVALSGSQRALIDNKTNKPLRLPNGELWVEKISTAKKNHYRNGVDCYTYDDSDKCLMLTYDSAAETYFYYDMATKRFFKPEVGENQKAYMHSVWNYNDGMYKFTIGTNAWEHDAHQVIYRQGKQISLGNENKFKSVMFSPELKMVTVTNMDGVGHMYAYQSDNVDDIKEVLPIDYSGKPVSARHIYPAYHQTQHELGRFVWINCNDLYSSNRVLYNIDTNRFYLNPITEDYIFNVTNGQFDRYSGHGTCAISKYPYCSYIVYELSPDVINSRIKVTIEDIYITTERCHNKVGEIPQTNKEAFIRYLKKYPEDSNPLIEKLLEYDTLNYEEYRKIKDEFQEPYRMAENKRLK